MVESDNNKAFLGIGWSFPPRFHKQGDALGVKMVTDEEDIRESLLILISTVPGERTMQPAYGCPLKLMLFESINESTVTEIRDVIDRAVLFFEPRITLERIDVESDTAYEGRINITLNYLIRMTNTRSNIVYPFYYLEGSQVKL